MTTKHYATWRHIQDLRKKAAHNARIAREHQDKANRQNQAADELEEIING